MQTVSSRKSGKVVPCASARGTRRRHLFAQPVSSQGLTPFCRLSASRTPGGKFSFRWGKNFRHHGCSGGSGGYAEGRVDGSPLERKPQPGAAIMKAFEIKGGFGLDALTLVERPDPRPGPGQVLLKMRAWSLNYRDLLIVK